MRTRGYAGHGSVDAILNNQEPDRTPTRVCTPSLSRGVCQILGLSARRVVGLIVEACGDWERVKYLSGMLVLVHNDSAI